jgi:hypothetical protein
MGIPIAVKNPGVVNRMLARRPVCIAAGCPGTPTGKMPPPNVIGRNEM